jgi:hypothetical protein
VQKSGEDVWFVNAEQQLVCQLKQMKRQFLLRECLAAGGPHIFSSPSTSACSISPKPLGASSADCPGGLGHQVVANENCAGKLIHFESHPDGL